MGRPYLGRMNVDPLWAAHILQHCTKRGSLLTPTEILEIYRYIIFTTAKVDCPYQLQVRVDPPDAVDIPTVFQAWTHWGLVQVFGFTSLPKTKHSTWSKSRTRWLELRSCFHSMHLFLPLNWYWIFSVQHFSSVEWNFSLSLQLEAVRAQDNWMITQLNSIIFSTSKQAQTKTGNQIILILLPQVTTVPYTDFLEMEYKILKFTTTTLNWFLIWGILLIYIPALAQIITSCCRAIELTSLVILRNHLLKPFLCIEWQKWQESSTVKINEACSGTGHSFS